MTIRVEEKSLELALLKAAGQLSVTQDMLEYRVVNETAGFLGLFGKKTCIEAWAKQENKKSLKTNGRKFEKKASNKKAKAPRRETKREHLIEDEDKRVLSTGEMEELSEDLKVFCEGICSRIAHEDVKVEKTIEEGRLVLNIQSDYIANQIMKNTKLAEAMEHILRKKPRYLRQELPFRIFVDCNSVRSGREQELVALAKDLSTKVTASKRPIVLNNYRSSYDRKIIHMALDQDTNVFTKSIGYGANRKLMILPHDAIEGAEAEVYE